MCPGIPRWQAGNCDDPDCTQDDQVELRVIAVTAAGSSMPSVACGSTVRLHKPPITLGDPRTTRL